MNKFLAAFNSPFLGNCDPKREVLNLFLIGVFVALFLGIFRPFGLTQFKGNIWFLTGLFGLVTWVVGMMYFLFCTYVLRIRQDMPSWKLWKWIIYVMILVLLVAIGNFLMINYLAGWSGLTFNVFLRYAINTVAIGIFPIFLSGMFSIIRNEKYYRQQASTLLVPDNPHQPKHPDSLIIPSTLNEKFEISADAIYFLEAEENYVAVFYKLPSQPPRKELIRNTFSSIDQYLPDNQFLRCHRSFIVNLNKVYDVQGNAQGLTVSFEDISQTVPVSRKHIPIFKERMIEA